MIASLFHNQVVDYCRDRINPSRIQSLPTFITSRRQTIGASTSKSNKQKQTPTTTHKLRQRRRNSDLITTKEYKKNIPEST